MRGNLYTRCIIRSLHPHQTGITNLISKPHFHPTIAPTIKIIHFSFWITKTWAINLYIFTSGIFINTSTILFSSQLRGITFSWHTTLTPQHSITYTPRVVQFCGIFLKYSSLFYHAVYCFIKIRKIAFYEAVKSYDKKPISNYDQTDWISNKQIQNEKVKVR